MKQELLDFALELGREAGRQLSDCYGRAEVGVKKDGTVITDADRAVDRFLHQQIGRRYPDHGILSEETETLYRGAPITWVIDPLDGTNNYALGVCYWGCSIAVVSEGTPVVGVLVMPVLGYEFWAAQGEGAYLNGERLGGHPRGVTERNSFLAICSRTARYLELPMRQKVRLLGSAAYDLAAVAQGIAVGCSLLLPHIWDLAAGWLLLQESGRAVGTLLPGAPDPFPMLPGAEYENKVFPLAAGADRSLLQQITGRVEIKPRARERFDSLAAAGWDTEAWRGGP